VEDKDRQKF